MSFSTTEGDIKLFHDNAPGPADIKFTDIGEVLLDDGLENMVNISFFTDQRAETNENIPNGVTDRKGWFGDILLPSKIGSKLWLLQRMIISNDLFELTKQYCEESLAWMIEDGIADDVAVSVTRGDTLNRIKIEGLILKVDGGQLGFAYYYNWKNQTSERI